MTSKVGSARPHSASTRWLSRRLLLPTIVIGVLVALLAVPSVIKILYPHTVDPASVVPVATRYLGVTGPSKSVEVASPTLFVAENPFGLAAHEQLWAFIKPPVDPTADTSADRGGLFKVVDDGPIVVERDGLWSVKADVGRGPCDQDKTYELRIVRIRTTPAKHYKSFVDIDRERRRYPEYASLPKDPNIVVVGFVNVVMRKYQGEHTGC
jgi:hypothetical protein